MKTSSLHRFSLAHLHRGILATSFFVCSHAEGELILPSKTAPRPPIVTKLSEAIKQAPDQAHLYAWRGIEYYNAQKYPEEALEDFTKALELAPDSAELHVARGHCLRLFFKDHEKASAEYTSALKLDANCSDAYVGFGWIKSAKGDYTGSIAEFDAALRINPDNTDASDGRASALYHSADPSERMSVLASTWSDRLADPSLPSASEMRILDVWNQKQYQPVIEKCTQALQGQDGAMPVHGRAAQDARLRRAIARYAIGDYDGCIEDYTTFITKGCEWSFYGFKTEGLFGRIKTNIEEVLILRANAYYQKQEHASAIADYELAMIDRANRTALIGRGAARKGAGDVSGAVADFSAALDIEENARKKKEAASAPASIHEYMRRQILRPSDKENLRLRVALSRRDGLFTPGLRCLNVFFERSLCHYQQGDLDNALADVEQAIKRDLLAKDEPRHRFLLWFLRQKRGDVATASAELSAFRQHLSANLPADAWLLRLCNFLTGAVSEKEILESAGRNQANAGSQHCEALFYAGVVRLSKGDKAGAQRHFRACLETKQHASVEYEMAAKELSELQP